MEMVKDDLTEEDIKRVEEGTVCLTKWLPDEWDIQMERTVR